MAKTTIDAIYTNGTATAVRAINCGTSSPKLKGTVRLNMFTGLTSFQGGDNNLEAVIDFMNLSNLKRFEIFGSNTVNFNVSSLPVNLEHFDIRGLNTTFGTLSSLPRTLTDYTNTGRNTTTGLLCGLPLNLEIYINTGQNTTSGPLSSLPRSLISYQNQGNNTTTGLLCGLPPGLLTYVNIGANQTTTGDLSSLPSSLEIYNNAGENTTTGDIANLPSGLVEYVNRGLNTTTGNLSTLPSNLTYYNNKGNNTVYSYYNGEISGYRKRVWVNNQNYWELEPALSSGVPGMPHTHLATLLVDLSGVTWTGNKLFTANVNNPTLSSSQPYWSKVEGAINAIRSQGVTVAILTAVS